MSELASESSNTARFASAPDERQRGGSAGDIVLAAHDVSVDYGVDHPVHAVREVTLELRRGEILGIAGESGCGKSTLAFALAHLLRPPARRTAGTVTFTEPDGTEIDIAALDDAALRRFRWRRLAMVFQSAMNALNPVTTIGRQLGDLFAAHQPELDAAARRRRAGELLDLVGIDTRWLRGFPHELSGGMRQRVGIAMALALAPDVVIMDEPTTALDVVVQREILDQIETLRAELGFAIVFITHDLALLMEISDRLAVMYAGRIVEQAPVARIAAGAAHPYTRALLRSFPDLLADRRDLSGVPGAPPDLRDTMPGCPFQPRCADGVAPCLITRPALRPLPDGGAVACHLHDPAYPGVRA